MDNPPLYALQDGVAGGNAVYTYSPTSAFPNQTYNSSNYWVDVVFATDNGPDTTPPTIQATTPANNATGVANTTAVTAVFNEPMDAATINNATFELRDAANNVVPATVSYTAANRTATLNPDIALAYSAAYTAVLKGGPGSVADLAGNEIATDYTWSFTTSAAPPPPPDQGPGGPILVVSSAANPFSRYYAEILRNEGLNAFTVTDITNVTDTLLDDYDVVILGEMALDSTQETLLTDWVTNNGGNLIAMRPDPDLAGLLGLTPAGGTLSEGYLLVNTASGPGAGIVGETIQFHGTADRYTLSGATAVATLYSNASTATSNPAVTLVSVGANGGQAATFTYDLAKSVVYTRQGNPAWAGDERDGFPPVRSNDMFYGAKTGDAQPDWIDLNKVQIPQADEQQRLLANLILQMNLDEMPLPRFWYFPRGEKAVIVMTGDDHASTNGTATHFDWFASQDPAGCMVDDWECIRSTSYIYPETPLSPSAAAAYEAQGFEVSIHVNTGCQADWTPATLPNFFAAQLATFDSNFPTVPAPSTHRTHCIAWSDWATQPQVELDFGIRLDANYYYWPESWVQNQPGYFTGSGMPMRFADLDGTMIDVYQAATQMPDESGIDYQLHTATLLDNALGAPGYYGVLTTNMHTDRDLAPAQTIVAVAKNRGVPVISARQMLTWLDGRNASTFTNLTWLANTLSFTLEIGAGANGLQTMVPAQSAAGAISSITLNGAPVAYTQQTIKGISYAIFEAGAGVVNVSYAADSTPPTATAFVPEDGAVDVPVDTAVRLTFSEPIDPATVNTTTFVLQDAANNPVPATVSYDGGSNTAILTPDADLNNNTVYSATALGGAPGITDVAGNPLVTDVTWTFTTAAPQSCPCTIWDEDTAVGVNGNDANSYELGVKFRSSQDGFIAGLRFYKYAANTGTHTGHLWDVNGNLLGSATFVNETTSGWQEVSFDPPIAITANTVYVASYATETGYYAFTANYFTTQGVNNGPLYALSAAESPAPGTNGVFSETPNQFPNTSFNDANYWVDVVFDTALPGDTTPPVISNVSAVPGAGGTAVITWETNEPTDSLVVFGTDSAVLDQSAAAATLVTNHQITLTGLDLNTTYSYRVISADAASNSATYPEPPAAPLTFVTPGLSLVDTAVADFSAGTAGACYISETDNGELRLAPTVGAEFSGTALPGDWIDFSWTGGASTVAAGAAFVDGARAATSSYYDAGRVIEFVATFQPETFQHVGLGQDLAELTESWAMFGTFNTTSTLYARTLQGGTQVNTPLAGNWLGSPHRYRIEWTSSQVDFFVDGSLVHSQAVTITENMRPVISDYQNSGQGVTVNWLHLSPYSDTCTFTSRVFDGGAVVDWLSAQWTGTTPGGTAVSVETRTGGSAVPDGTWSAWQAVVGGGTMVNPNGRYAQYRLTLASTDTNATPVVQDVTLVYAAGDNTPPQITILGDNPATVEVGDPYTDGGASALDESDGDLTANIITTSTVDSSTVGSYTVTYAVDDSSGNVATAVRIVNVIDTGMPIITILGDNPAAVEVGTPYTDAGATATDIGDGDLTSAIVATSTVDTNSVGSYTVTYTVEDSSGNVVTAVRTVNVIDTTEPIITILGDNPATVEVGTPYADAGATAIDIGDGDLTAEIVTTSTVDSNIVGSYTVTYAVEDSSGNVATAVRTVNVVDTTEPVITILGDNPATVEVGMTYSDAGVTAFDVGDGDLTDAVVVTSNVNTSVLGSYTVIYDVMDSSGNAAMAIRTVNVVSGAPTANNDTANTDEDMAVTIDVLANDSGSGSLTVSTVTQGGHGTVVNNGTNVSYTPNANFYGSDSFTYTLSDGNGSSTASVVVTVNPVNDAPQVGFITAPVDPVQINASLTATAVFTDADQLDMLTAVWDWGDGSTTTQSLAGTSGTAVATHTYTTPDVYIITLTINDAANVSAMVSYEYIVVYDPAAGGVTGVGWFYSPPGSFDGDPNLNEKGRFGFVVRYKRGIPEPIGSFNFTIYPANLRIDGLGFDWLVVNGPKASFQGYGSIDGSGDYGFFVSLIDGGDQYDLVRVRIWNRVTGNVLFDSQPGNPLTVPAAILVEGGSITIKR
jgi:hypothetical protein